MAVREIPRSFEHTCDACKAVEVSTSKDRPRYWSGLVIEQDAYDYQGCAVADGTVRRLLCGDCTKIVTDAVNKATSARAALEAKP